MDGVLSFSRVSVTQVTLALFHAVISAAVFLCDLRMHVRLAEGLA